MKEIENIETERTIMRKLTKEDAKDFYTLNLDEEVLKFTGDKPFKDLQTAIDFLTNYDQYEKYGVGRLAVIDKSTLSIHFPNMIDSQGNKIFASLSEDRKGGDILQYKDKYNCCNTSYIFNIIYSKEYNALCVREIDEEKELDFFYELPTFIKEGLKIIGIQQ